MRRLFSTFAHGWPGAGLLVLRLVGGAACVASAVDTLRSGPPGPTAAAATLATVAGLFLLAGLWTPIAGALVAAIGIWFALTLADDPLASLLLAAIGAALALVGPGAWSIDARLFGWKRIDVRDRARWRIPHPGDRVRLDRVVQRLHRVSRTAPSGVSVGDGPRRQSPVPRDDHEHV